MTRPSRCLAVAILPLFAALSVAQPLVEAVPRIVRFAGAVRNAPKQPSGIVGATFSIYREQDGGAALWSEVQNVEVDRDGNYTALLGSTRSEGVPVDLFTVGEQRWLEVRFHLPEELVQPRVLLVSVPYALKAADA